MKRLLHLLIPLFLVLLFISFDFKKVNAASNINVDTSDYRKFSSMQLSSGKLLKNYSKSEIKMQSDACKKKKFSGWRINFINKHVRCNFTSQTILSIYNDGTSPITYKLSETQTKMYKVSISTTGSLGGSLKGDVKKFKGGLDAKVGMETSYTSTIDVKTAESLEIQVDPGTKASIYLKGSGYLTTGYAVLYTLWLKDLYGCFEFFEVVDCYPKIVKERIR